MPKSMRNIEKYADNETYVVPENAHIVVLFGKIFLFESILKNF
jgi:hypothetical protein